jgi:hypothetical protein
MASFCPRILLKSRQNYRYERINEINFGAGCSVNSILAEGFTKNRQGTAQLFNLVGHFNMSLTGCFFTVFGSSAE